MPDLSFDGVLVIALVAVAVPLLLGLVPRLPVPGAVLEVLAGIVIGPTALGWVHVDAPVQVLSDLGLGMLLFLAGLEIDVGGLRGPLGRLAGRAFGGSVLLGLACGYVLSLAGVGAKPVFLAVVLTSTSAGLLLPLLKDAGRPSAVRAAGDGRRGAGRSGPGHDAVPAVLGLIDHAGGPAQLAGGVARLAGGHRPGPRAGAEPRRAGPPTGPARGPQRPAASPCRPDPGAGLRRLAARFGFASILGAFAAGLLVRTIDLTNRTPHPQFQIKLEGIGFGFLVPVFFITTGAQFDARALVSNPAALATVPLFLLARLVVRGLPALAYARLTGKRQAAGACLMQATTLTFVIVATQIGLASGQVSQATGAALLAAALLSATIFPAVAVKLLAAVSPRAEQGRARSVRTRYRAGGGAAQQPQGRRRIDDDRQQARHHQGGGGGRPLVTGLHPDDGRHHDERQGRGLHETSSPGAGAPDGPDVQHGRDARAPSAAPPGTPARERSPCRWRTRRTRPGRRSVPRRTPGSGTRSRSPRVWR